jgi:carbon monoxide dehydrogenase subunit G
VKVEGSAVLPGTLEEVWALLTDPARLAKLLPGCEQLDPDGPDRFRAAVKFGIAAISGKYAGMLEFTEKKPPKSLRLKIDGKGVPGWMKGEGQIELARHGGHASKSHETEVHYSGEAQVGGVVAAVGQRMIDMAARKIVQQFFESAANELKSTTKS